MVYRFKATENEPKDFGSYQMPLGLFEDLQDGDINPKEVLKKQARFKLDLSEVKIGKKNSRSKNTIKNIATFFDVRGKIIDWFRDYSF